MLPGLGTRTQEAYVGTPDGVVGAWTMKRTGEHDRWKVGQDEPQA